MSDGIIKTEGGQEMDLCMEMPLGIEQDQYDIFSRAMDYLSSALNQVVLEKLDGPEPKVTVWIRPVGNIMSLSTGLLRVRVTTPIGRFIDQAVIQFRFDGENQITGLLLESRSISPAEIFYKITKKAKVAA